MSTRGTATEPALTRAEARAILDEAITRHFAKVRARIPVFVERNFGWRGAWKLNRKGIGRDLYRAPLNAALIVPHTGLRIAATLFDKRGRRDTAEWLRSRDLFLKTDVAREIEWRIWTELLELPYADGARVNIHDGLAREMLSDIRLASRLEMVHEAMRRHWSADGYEARLAQALGAYSGNRTAAGEIANIFVSLGAGAALLHQATPGVLTLGPALANLIAQALHSHSMPAAMAAIALGIAPVQASVSLTATATAAVAATLAATSAISGAVIDPIQSALGLHQRRLLALSNAVELLLLGDDRARLVAHDHYAGRVGDLVDLFVGIWRFARL
jgi:Family of unknown function (DUF6635)